MAPFMQTITGTMLEPVINGYLSNIPDDAIPEMAHAIVDQAITNGGWTFFDGNLTFDKEDMESLKHLLDYNLPLAKPEKYQVKNGPQ